MHQILIIDDEATIRLMLRGLLERLGHSVLEAPDGEAGLQVCHHQSPDLVITDLAMPKKGGLETIMELQRDFPQVRIIAMTGEGADSRNNLQQARALGAHRAFHKTILTDCITDAVSEFLLSNSG